MNKRGLGLVMTCCLLTASAAGSSSCFAQSLLRDAVDSSSASAATTKPKAPTPQKVSKRSFRADDIAQATNPASYNNSLGWNLFKNIGEDQKAIWTSPAHVRFSDTEWMVPVAGITAGLLETDTDFSRHLSNSPSRLNNSNTFSNIGIGSLVGAGAGLYLLGRIHHDDHKRETGVLAGEAAIDSLAVTYAGKYVFQRERPLQDNYQGRFWQGGDSFPSEHASAAWSIAGVIAHEYPGPLTSLLSYGMASAVTASRLTAQKHFPTDVVIGSLIGWFVAQEVYTHHHNPELGGTEWNSVSEIFRSGSGKGAANQGSPYVPLDSWVYPAFDRLEALGVINGAFTGMRPWTRSECARLLDQADDRIDDGTAPPEAKKIYDQLQTEFWVERNELPGSSNTRAKLESVYSRIGGISGEPLNNSYNFGQTIYNDFGRPYQEGFNTVDGISGWATSGRWVGYVRAEFQHAPSAPALPLTARQTIANVDGIPVIPPATPEPAVNRVALIDAYGGLNFDNWQFTFGPQSLWWGPSRGGAMVFGDNAEPIDMFRVNRITPFQLPSFLKIVGPIRTEFFIGQQEGQQFFDTATGTVGSWTQTPNPQPLIDGIRFSFKPSENLEVGFSYTTTFGGVGIPITFGSFIDGLFDIGELPDGTSKSSRQMGFDFTYRIPKLRNWLTLYAEGLTHDQLFFIDPKARPLPFGYPERAAWNTGIYVPAFPGLRRLDFRAEGGYTSNPVGPHGGYDVGFYYTANRYLSGYTNEGYLLGSWLGRAGQGEQAWSNYWLGARSRIQLRFRHLIVSRKFIPGGETINDGSAMAELWVHNVSLSGRFQYERWFAPVLAPTPQRNWTSSFQIAFYPHFLGR